MPSGHVPSSIVGQCLEAAYAYLHLIYAVVLLADSSIGESSDFFGSPNVVELAIVAVCTFAVTLIVLVAIFLLICSCYHRKTMNISHTNSHEMDIKY